MNSNRYNMTPNYQLMFESTVGALQDAYAEYKKARVKQIQWTSFDNDGRLCFLGGYKELKERIDNAEEEVERLLKEVERLRELRGGDTE